MKKFFALICTITLLMAGTAFSGIFIDALGTAYVIFGGLIFAACSAVVVWIQSARRELNPLAR